MSDAVQRDVQAATADLLAMLPPPQSGYSAISRATVAPLLRFHVANFTLIPAVT
jgi:hypothetical protein